MKASDYIEALYAQLCAKPSAHQNPHAPKRQTRRRLTAHDKRVINALHQKLQQDREVRS